MLMLMLMLHSHKILRWLQGMADGTKHQRVSEDHSTSFLAGHMLLYRRKGHHY